MTDAEKNELRDIVRNFTLEEQLILTREVDDAVLIEEIRHRLISRKAHLETIGKTAEEYIYGK